QNEEVIAIRSTHTAEDGFDLFAPKDLVETISNEFKTLGAIKIGDEARETLRIEAGIPSYGLDADETTVVLETGLDEAVSFKKGCYVGQEIIARIHFRGHVAKQLTGLILDETAPVAPNDELKSVEGKAAGRITSTVFSPTLGKRIALALVRYEFLAPGTELLISPGEDQIPARVCELPFVRGSWYSV
ncbi:MAG TPA: glycine cleavage T C-terminal barrel domain-containing protein, partial [Pyrinomonadaceae bacterium]|nr:glycine cleavage T C-terminal barrel domain-containing protein [Pyrinomonadaceae bacterium]